MTASVWSSDPTPARSNGLDNIDGGPDAAFYIQIGIVEQDCILRLFQRGGGAILVAFVAPPDIGKYILLGDTVARMA